MKARIPYRFASLITWTSGMMAITAAGHLQAASQYWNPGGTGGDGIWGTGPGDKNWNLVPGALVGNTAWQDGIDDVAVFQDATGGIVTVFDTVQTAGIIQNGANYTVNAGIIVLAPDAALNAPFVNVQSGILTMDAQIAGSAGLLKTGGGTLILTAANPYTGPTAIQGGTVNLAGSLASTSISISAGASLLNQIGGLANSTSLTNAGSLTLNANDTIAAYISNGGTLTAGAGTLFTSSAALTDGSSVAGLLNTVTLTSDGAVSISGTATAGSASIQSGVLTLSGTLISDTVNIASGASLLNQNGGLSNSATLTNAGSFTLNTDDTIASYISNGGTLAAGPGTLFTTSAILNNGSSVAGLLNTATLTSDGAVSISGTATAGSASIQSGVLTLSGTLISDTVNIVSGASLLNQNGGLSNSATLTNAGSLTLNANDTIASYISNGGTLAAGPGTLFTTSAILNNGSSVAGLLNTATLTSNGVVSISGTATAGSASIQSGVLTLSGTLASDTVGIASGASLLNQSGGLSNSATLTNAGSLTLNADDSIASYISNAGTLTAGPGTLFTTSAALNNGSSVAGLLNAVTLTSDGAVSISGTATAGSASIQSGVLTLSGGLVSDTVGIASGASLLNQNGGLSSSATLTNAGSLTLNADDTIASYISNAGTLTAGPGTLFTTSAALNNASSVAGLLNAVTLTSDGAVSISGTATAGSASIQSGTLTLSGTLASNTVGIASGASLLNQSGGLSNSATLTNAGSLTLNADDTIASYISNAGTLTAGPGTLFTTSAALNNGSSVAGLLNAVTLTSDGAVSISGTATAGSASIQSGTLTLSGTLASNSVGIASGASLLNLNGGLSNTATLTNAGSLALNLDDTITSYISNGGTLTAGIGALFATDSNLNNGSSIAGLLNTGTLTSNGAVQVTGAISANSINIATGTLTNTGTLGNVSTLLNINQGATLAAGGIQQYSLLTTSGAGAGTWLGDLNNTRAIAPGGLGAIGILAIGGNFTQSAGATLTLDLSTIASDLLDITGSAGFNGSLELNQLGAAIAPFVPVTVVSASAYAGNITSLSENLDGAVFFNPGNGTVIRIEIPAGGAFPGSTRNQTSTWISLYDDVIDPGITNITSGPGGIDITSGIADAGNPDLLWALFASFTPTGLNSALLNRLSPEVYGGFSDYAMQATRAHQRSALSAPALDPRDNSKSGMAGSAKGGAKGGIAETASYLDWEFFAAVDYFRAGTDNSLNQADYDFDGMGVLAGARTRPWENTQLAVYAGADSGTIDGELIDADAIGWNLGAIGEYLLHEKSRTRLTAGISYGSYVFDGSRGSASATAAGWAPGEVDFDDVGVDAYDLFIGVDGVAWKQDAFTLIPSAGLRYAMTTMDSFGESTGAAPGSPIALDVNRDRHESLLLELGLLAQVEVNPKLALWGEGGVNIGLLDDGRTLAASFAKGSRGMRAEADGLEDDSFYLGCGAVYRITDDISAGLGYRAELRSGAEAQQELRLSSSWRF